MGSITFNVGFVQETKDKGYKYKDLKMPIRVDNVSYNIEDLKDLNSIRNGIQNIFEWNKGERILNPEFGLNLRQYLGEPINENTAKAIGSEIDAGLEEWEPRIIVKDIRIEPLEDQNQYNVSVLYSVKSFDTIDQRFNISISRDT